MRRVRGFIGLTCLGVVLSAVAFLFLPGQRAFGQQHVVVVLDDSGSMADPMRKSGYKLRRMDAAKNALRAVLQQLPRETQVGVVTLNSQVAGSNFIVPLGPASPDRWQGRIESIVARGGTPLGQYLKIAADELLKARQTEVYGTYRLLIVTDGEANRPQVVERYLPDILSRGILVDVIGVDMQSDHSLATKVHNYRRADDAEALEQAISEVFAELSDDDSQLTEDFELLADLPDGFAELALAELTRIKNEPIAGNSGWSADDSSASFSTPTVSSAGSGVLGLVCCLGPFGFVFVIFIVLFKALTSKRRR